MDIIASLGIDIPSFFGFLFACLLSWYFADSIIQRLYSKRFDEMMGADQNLTGKDIQRGKVDLANKLDLDFGKRIGRIERVFYIYSIMFNALTLLSAWVILKAFYGWIQKPEIARSLASESTKEITTFYLYIYGNALSLLMGLIMAHAGKVAAHAIHWLLMN